MNKLEIRASKIIEYFLDHEFDDYSFYKYEIEETEIYENYIYVNASVNETTVNFRVTLKDDNDKINKDNFHLMGDIEVEIGDYDSFYKTCCFEWTAKHFWIALLS